MKNYLSLTEAATYLRLPVNTLYKLTSKRIIPFYKPGKRIILDQEELDKWLIESKQKDLSLLLKSNSISKSLTPKK
jgi:excisionase family DNA binding protein